MVSMSTWFLVFFLLKTESNESLRDEMGDKDAVGWREVSSEAKDKKSKAKNNVVLNWNVLCMICYKDQQDSEREMSIGTKTTLSTTTGSNRGSATFG